MRVNHTYGRGGALAYPGHEPEPYASAERVLRIVDNGS